MFNIAIEPLAELLRKSNLRGRTIPGLEERLIATLFADDTTVYLSGSDDWGELTGILDKWCLASGAKFNIGKTEIIPIGKREYRNRVRLTRKIGGHQGTALPADIHIAREGEAIRSLGAWIGTNIFQVETWTRTIEKVEAKLNQWAKSKPTLEGKRLIIQMFVGGMTQYLTSVQGMPEDIADYFQKIIQDYFWEGKTKHAVNADTIHAPIEVGGRKLLNIKNRNKAIAIMWLKSYLQFGT